ncbi:MAG: DUF2142 domain-containing protein [Clostridiales bacterium]|nr:DUF2142 domain-containing protein [Clostridiales bacterium]
MRTDGFDRNMKIRIAVAAVAGIAVLFALFGLSKSVFMRSGLYVPTEQFVQLESGVPVITEVNVLDDDPVLRSVNVTFATYDRRNNGQVKVELLEDGNPVYEWNIEASELLDNAIRVFEANRSVRLRSGAVYSVRITETYEGENYIAVGQSLAGRLSCYLTSYDRSACLKWFVIMSLIFAAGYVLLIFKGGLLDRPAGSLAIIGLAAVFALFVLGFDLFPNIKNRLSVRSIPSSTGVWDTIEAGQEKEYTFSYDGEEFDGLELFTTGPNASEYKVTLVNETTGVTFFEDAAVRPEWRVSTGRACLLLSAGDSMSGQRYYGNGQFSLRIANTGADAPVSIELAGEPSDGSLPSVTFACIRSSDIGIKTASLILVIIYLYILAPAFLRKYGKLTAGSLFLVTVLPLSFLYLIFFQPWNVPDCGAHFMASYRFSNLLTGINGDREWFGRACDAVYYNSASWWTERTPDLEGVAQFLHGLRQGAGDTTIVDLMAHEDKMKYYSLINYLPQTAGLIIGRLAGLGAGVTVLIARLFILAAYIAACYRAIRNTPTGKIIFAGIALLPVSLMMSSSFSYDAMIIISQLNFIAIILKLKKEYSRGALIEGVIWAFVLGAVKGGAGLFFLPLALLLIRRDKRSVITVCSVIGTALLSVLLFDKILPSDELFQFGVAGSKNMMTSFAFEHPVEYLKMLVRTYLYFGDTYLEQALGGQLSFLEPTVSTVAVIGAALSLLVCSTFEKDDLELDKTCRTVFILISAAAFVITPAMLLSYTPAGSGMIYGVQGRYLFPVMPLLALCAVKFGLKRPFKDEEGRRDASVSACIDIYVVFTLIIVYMMVGTYLAR